MKSTSTKAESSLMTFFHLNQTQKSMLTENAKIWKVFATGTFYISIKSLRNNLKLKEF